MGALGFLGGFTNAVSKSRQAQADPIDQALKLYQLRQALTEDPIRRALLNKQVAMEGKTLVKMPDGTSQLIDLSNPGAPGRTIGTPRNYARDLRMLKMTAPTGLQPLIQSAIDSGDPNLQEQVLKTAQDDIGKAATSKPSQFDQELNLYRTDPTAYAGMKAAGRAPVQPKAIKWLPSHDAEGHSIQIPTDPVTGARIAGVAPVGGKLGTQEVAALEATRSLTTDIPKLQAAADKIATGGPFKAALEYRKYKYPMFGLGGPVDPDYEDYFSQIGNIKSELAKLQSTGSSRSMSLLRFIQDHIPKETDPPAVAMRKLQTLQKGRFDSLTKAILGDDASSTPAGGPPDLSKMTADVGTPVTGPGGRITTFKPAGPSRATP